MLDSKVEMCLLFQTPQEEVTAALLALLTSPCNTEIPSSVLYKEKECLLHDIITKSQGEPAALELFSY